MGREGRCRQTSLAVWGALAVFQPHWVCPGSRRVCFPRLHCSGSRLLSRERALGCMHFPGLSRSDSRFWVLHKDADSVGPAFCAFPAQAPQAARSLRSALSPGAGPLIPSVVPASLSACDGTVRLVLVSSGEPDSSRDSPGGCRPSRISGSL